MVEKRTLRREDALTSHADQEKGVYHYCYSVYCTEVHLKIPEAIDILSLKLYSIELELPVKFSYSRTVAAIAINTTEWENHSLLYFIWPGCVW